MDARFAALQEALADYAWVLVDAHEEDDAALRQAASTYRQVLAYVSRRDTMEPPMRRSP